MKRLVLETVKTSIESKDNANVFIYPILLHEYLHILGYSEEARVRIIVHRIAKDSFGQDHKITTFSRKGLSTILPQILEAVKKRDKVFDFEIVKDFDRSSMKYIV
jgi:hypothetical protein